MAGTSNSFFDDSSIGLKVGHINVCSLNPQNPKFCEIHELIGSSKLDVICISETWLHDGISTSAVDIEGYRFFRCDRANRRGGGVGLYISKSLSCDLFLAESYNGPLLNCFEALVVKVQFTSMDILIGVLYVPPTSDIKCTETLISSLSTQHFQLILMGDLNCNLLDANSSVDLISLCFRNNLTIVHNNIPTHYDVAHRSSSLLDVFLVSDVDKVVESKQISVSSNISKHSFIALLFNAVPDNYTNDGFMSRNINGINVNALLSYAAGLELNFLLGINDVNELVFTINQYIVHILDIFAPLKHIKILKKSKFPFMNTPEVKTAKKERDDAYKDYVRNGQSDHVKWRNYCVLRNRVSKLIKKKKYEYAEEFFNDSDSKSLWNKVKSSGGGSPTNNTNIPDEINLNSLNDHFTNLTNASVFRPSFRNIEDCDDAFYFNNIDIGQLWFFVNSLKSNAVGSDNISIKVVKLLFPVFGRYLLHLFNTILTTSIFPDTWKMANVVPIPKKKNPTEFKDIRPISKLPALSKVLERILKHQIMENSIVESKLNDFQSGYRKHFNTTTSILQTTETIRSLMDKKQCTFLFLFDLSRAFDMIDPKILLYKLKSKYNFSFSACKLIETYLLNRKQRVIYKENVSKENIVMKGVPQGSILGPLLFLIFINDLADVPKTFHFSFFADDIQAVVSCKHSDLQNCINLVNSDLNSLSEWCLNNGLIINERKTQLINFSSHTPCNFYNDLFFLNGFGLKSVDEVKCLGFVIDRKLSWENHINLIVRRVNLGIRTLNHCNFIFPLAIRKKLALALLVCHVSYGIEITSGATLTVLHKLKVCMNNITRFVFKIPWREHISHHVIELLGCSFFDFIKSRCLLLLYKTIYFEQPKYLKSNIKFGRSQLKINDIILPVCRYEIMMKSFNMRAALLWNCHVPNEILYRTFRLKPNKFKNKIASFL